MGKKVLLIVASPRRNGNSEILCNEFIQGTKEGEMPAAGQSLEFVSCEVLNDGVVRLQYKFHHDQEG